MSFAIKYAVTIAKLEKICDENNLQVTFEQDDYPIVFRFEPLHEDDAQQRLDSLDDDDGGPSKDPEACMELIFGDELVVHITKGFTIDDHTLTRLKNISKTLHYLHLQICFRKAMEAMTFSDAIKENNAANGEPKDDSAKRVKG